MPKNLLKYLKKIQKIQAEEFGKHTIWIHTTTTEFSVSLNITVFVDSDRHTSVDLYDWEDELFLESKYNQICELLKTEPK